MPVNSSKQSPCWKLKFDEQDRICWRTKALIGYKLTAPISSGLSAARVVLSTSSTGAFQGYIWKARTVLSANISFHAVHSLLYTVRSSLCAVLLPFCTVLLPFCAVLSLLYAVLSPLCAGH